MRKGMGPTIPLSEPAVMKLLIVNQAERERKSPKPSSCHGSQASRAINQNLGDLQRRKNPPSYSELTKIHSFCIIVIDKNTPHKLRHCSIEKEKQICLVLIKIYPFNLDKGKAYFMKVKRNKYKEKIVKFLNNLVIKLGKNSFVNESCGQDKQRHLHVCSILMKSHPKKSLSFRARANPLPFCGNGICFVLGNDNRESSQKNNYHHRHIKRSWGRGSFTILGKAPKK